MKTTNQLSAMRHEQAKLCLQLIELGIAVEHASGAVNIKMPSVQAIWLRAFLRSMTLDMSQPEITRSMAARCAGTIAAFIQAGDEDVALLTTLLIGTVEGSITDPDQLPSGDNDIPF